MYLVKKELEGPVGHVKEVVLMFLCHLEAFVESDFKSESLANSSRVKRPNILKFGVADSPTFPP